MTSKFDSTTTLSTRAVTGRRGRTSQLWREWLQDQIASGGLVRNLRVLRVSSPSRATFRANMMTTLSSSDLSDPDVRQAIDWGVVLVENSVEGDAARAKTGTYHLRLSSLPGGEHSQKHLGYATVFGRSLFIYLMGSAAEGNLRIPGNSEDWLNAATETVREAIRRLAQALPDPEPLAVHWSEETRVARGDQPAADILQTMRVHGVRLLLRGVEYDLVNQALVVRMLLGMAATDHDVVVDRTSRGKAGLLLANLLPEAKESTVPFTHGPAIHRFTDHRGRQHEREEKHELALRSDAVDALVAIVRRIIKDGEAALHAGQPIPWQTIAEWASKNYGLTSRMPADVKNFRNGLPVSDLKDPGMALRRAFDSRYVKAWRTGMMPWETVFPIENNTVRLLTPTGRKDDRGRSIYRAEIECPRPDGGYPLSEEEWDRLEAVLQPRSPLAGRSLGQWSSPFNSKGAWIEGSEERWIDCTNGAALRLMARPKDDATSALSSSMWTHLASANAHLLYRDMGMALSKAATQLEDGAARLVVHRPWDESSGADTEAHLKAIRDEIVALETRRTELRIEAEAFGATARHTSDAHARAHLERMVQAKRAEFESIDSEVFAKQHALTTIGAASVKAQEKVDFTTLEQVAGGLQHDWGHECRIPTPLTTAVRQLFRNTVRLTVEDSNLLVRWSATLHLELDDGQVARSDLTGTVPNRPHQRNGRSIREPLELLRRRLEDGLAWEPLGALWGIAGTASKNSHLHRILDDALKTGIDGRSIPSALARRIILYSGPAEVRRAVWSHLSGSSAPLPGVHRLWRDHVIATYTDPDFEFTEAWVGRDHTLQRMAMDAVTALADPRSGLAILDAAALLGRDYTGTCNEMTYNKRAGKAKQPPPFTTNWTRTGNTPITDRRLFARECRNRACPGRGAGAGGRTVADTVVLMSQILWTPESPDGVLCPSCKQTSSIPGVPFPDVYFQPWRRINRVEVTK